MPDARQPWDEYFMQIAAVVASRSTCPPKFIGAVMVRDRIILSTGYNGSIRGTAHCTDAGHMLKNDHCIATIHAESNAILQAARNGVATVGATLYITGGTCWICFKQIANSGIKRVVSGEAVTDEKILSIAQQIGMQISTVPVEGGQSHR
jgi:dCMP deaminase